MIIDGDPIVHVMWHDLFEEQGHEVTVLENGADAINQGHETPPDAVLIDMEALPTVGHGLLLVENLRMDFPDVPIIVIAGGPLSLICGSIRELGADVCLSKPVDYPALMRMVEVLLSHVAPRVQTKPAEKKKARVAERQFVR
jgi:CheY-like chemotaxis protein